MNKKVIIGVIIALLIIVIGVVGVYKLIEKDVTNGDDFKVEVENMVSNPVNTISHEQNISNEENITKYAEETYKKYLDILSYKNNNIGPMPEILIKLGFETEESIEKILSGKEESDSLSYLKSNTKYNDFENEMLKYFSQDFFKKYYSQYIDMDGYVGFCNCAGGIIPYSLKTITFDYEENEEYYFDVVLIDMEMYEHFTNPEQEENIKEEECYINTKVIFKKENGNLVIVDETY